LINFIVEKQNEIISESKFKNPVLEQEWIDAMKALYLSNKQQQDMGITKEINTYRQMTVDVNRAFLLYCSSMVNYHLMHLSAYGAIHFVKIAAICAFYTLKESDPHYS